MHRVVAEVQRLAPMVSKRIVLLTGASRGYGQALAKELTVEAVAFGRWLRLVFVSRDSAGMTETENAILALSSPSGDAESSSKVRCKSFVADLSAPQQLEADFEGVLTHITGELASIDSSEVTEVLLIHNSGSLGRLAYAQDLNAMETAAAFDLNITSTAVLSQLILRHFAQKAQRPNNSVQIVIVNISSLLAIQAMPSWSLYSTAKAARDMLMKALDVEAKALNLEVKTLSWAPGLMHTDLIREALDTCPYAQTRHQFEAMRDDAKMVDTRDSAAKLVRLLQCGAFESAAHIDYFDI